MRVKTGGRKKGVPNKKASLINALLDYLINGGIDKFKKELNTLSGKDYVNAMNGLVKIINIDAKRRVIANEYLSELITKTKQNDNKNRC